VAADVREGFGPAAAAVTGAWFMTAVLLGAPAVSLIGGYYVADLTGSRTGTAVAVGLAMFAVVPAANAFGLRVSSGFQLGLSAVFVLVVRSGPGSAARRTSCARPRRASSPYLRARARPGCSHPRRPGAHGRRRRARAGHGRRRLLLGLPARAGGRLPALARPAPARTAAPARSSG
jgi:hypothetical protein